MAPFKMWKHMAALGYVVDHCTSFDLHAETAILDPYILFASVGHDEYWSKEMRQRVEAHVAAGKNAVFFGGNAVWWEVRFENSGKTMVCYKAAIDDPATGDVVTANYASTPPSWPENFLTGLSFKRGTWGRPPEANAKFHVVANPASEPAFLAGIAPDTWFPADPGATPVFNLETDACEVDETFSPTGKDGTATSFRVLAHANFNDLPFGQIGRPGAAVIGYFQNNGTVFNVGTTDWAFALNDPTVAQLTENVLATLTAPFTGPPWTPPPRDYPTSTWEAFSTTTIANATGICGIVQGHLLVMQSTDGTAKATHPEIKALAFQWTNVPTISPLKGLAADSWGKRLFAAVVPITGPSIFTRDARIDRSDAWAPLLGEPGLVEAIGANIELWASVLISGTNRFLYTVDGPNSDNWTVQGRTTRVIKSMAGIDGNVFAMDQDGRLLCRQNTRVDLAWAEIGTVPANAVALAGYFGRLFCLAGPAATPTLYWRAAVASKPIDPTLLFASSSTSAFAVGRMSGDGKYEPVSTPSAPAFVHTHIVRAGPDLVFRYSSVTRGGQLLRLNPDGTLTQVFQWGSSSFGVWTHIVAITTPGQGDRVLFYNSSSGYAVIGRFETTSPYFVQEYANTFATGFTLITCTWNGNIIFYVSSSGYYVWCTYAGGVFTTVGSAFLSSGRQELLPIGSSSFLLRKNVAPWDVTIVDVWGTTSTAKIGGTPPAWLQNHGRMAPCSNGLALAYAAALSQAFGAAIGPTSGRELVQLRSYANAFASGWTDFIALDRVV